MPKVSVSEAARLAGITRQYFYKKYINTGVISVETDNNGVKGIDTAEIIRVCGELKGDSQKETQIVQVMTPEKDIKIAALEAENRLLREMFQAKEDHISDLQQALRLLEHRPAPDTTTAPEPTKKRRWWQFS